MICPAVESLLGSYSPPLGAFKNVVTDRYPAACGGAVYSAGIRFPVQSNKPIIMAFVRFDGLYIPIPQSPLQNTTFV